MANEELCPECGSAKVEMTGPGGKILAKYAKARCASCGWEGTQEDLIIPLGNVEVNPEVLTPDQALHVAEAVAKQYMQMLAAHAAKPIGLAMVESGMVGVQDAPTLGRLIKAACKGAWQATLDEVEAMQQEIRDADGTTGN